MINKFTVGKIFYRQECIEVRVDVGSVESDNFDLNALNLAPLVAICNLDLLELEKETQGEAKCVATWEEQMRVRASTIRSSHIFFTLLYFWVLAFCIL